MKIIGLDSGSTTTKGVLLENGEVVKKKLLLTAGNPVEAMEDILDFLGHDNSIPVITTGYGRNLISSDRKITEITCHAKGAHFLNPEVEGVIDIGGQDSKVIKLNSRGKVDEFIMNDRCAAGTGRFIEVIMRTLGEDIENLDDFVKDATPAKINSMCTVFAESEVVGLIGKGEARENVALGVLHSVASRVSSQFKQINPTKGKIFFSGGLTKSDTIRGLLEEYTECEIYSHELAQYAGAIGAALMGI